jgi:fructose-1,6-bisphosphatase/inositol monophosphatase family enzyme
MVAEALRLGFEHRRCGSTAIQLCWVADGRCDAFVTRYCSAWDCLAGLILVEGRRAACHRFHQRPRPARQRRHRHRAGPGRRT